MNSSYTYKKSGAVVGGTSVTLTASATTYAITAAEKTSGLTFYGYKGTEAITGINFKDIKTSSYDDGTITLGLTNDKTITFENVSSSALVLGNASVDVYKDYFAAGTSYTLTADKKDFKATGDVANIDGSYVTNGSISGTSGNDTIIGSGTGTVTMSGGAGNDLFTYKGGSAFITDYTYSATEKDSIGFANKNVELDLTTASIQSVSGQAKGNVIIDGKLTIKAAEEQDIIIGGQSYFFSDLGTFNDDKTAVTLRSTLDKAELTADKYKSYGLSTIDGSNITGNLNVSLTSKAETFIYGGGSVTLNEFTATADQISINGGMKDLSGVSVDDSITLNFGSDKLIIGAESTATVSINGKTFTFNDNEVYTADKKGVTLVSSNQNVDIASAAYQGVASVVANNGGTISAGAYGVFIGGKNVSVKGGGGADTFLYNGGSMTIASYTTADQIKLADGYSISGAPTVTKTDNKIDQIKLAVVDSEGASVGTITLNEVSSLKSVKVSGTTYYLPEDEEAAGENLFNNTDAGKATAVTVTGTNGDFSAVTETTETYAGLYSITADKNNSTLAGNSKANTFYVAGGDSNILTGGIGKDTFIFSSGGGIVTDFGIGAAQKGDGTALATSASSNVVNDPTAYAEGNDVVKVTGKVVEIAFNGHGITSSKTKSIFSAYVTYDSDLDGEGDSTILLGNIVKKPTKTGASPVWQTDDVAAKTLKIWDTNTGTSKVLSSTALNKLFVTPDTSAYVSNFDSLNALVNKDDAATIAELSNATSSTTVTPSNGLKVTSSGTTSNNDNGLNG